MSLELFLRDTKVISQLRQGLFGPHLDAFAQQLRDRGYNHAVAGLHLRLIGDFGRWVERNRIGQAELSSKHMQEFVRCRQLKRKPTGCDASAVTWFLRFLRDRKVLADEELACRRPRQIW